MDTYACDKESHNQRYTLETLFGFTFRTTSTRSNENEQHICVRRNTSSSSWLTTTPPDCAPRHALTLGSMSTPTRETHHDTVQVLSLAVRKHTQGQKQNRSNTYMRQDHASGPPFLTFVPLDSAPRSRPQTASLRPQALASWSRSN